MRGRVVIAAVLAVGVVLPATAQAHPHVWIENRIAFVFDNGAVTGMRLTWRFDELFSSGLIADFDADASGSFEPEEIAQLHDNAFIALADYHYLSYLWFDGEPFQPSEVSDFSARLEDGVVIYSFLVPFPSPQDPHRTRIQTEVHDAEYYIEVLLAEEEPVTLEGYAGTDCQPTIADDPDNAYYYGMVYPQQVTLACGG